MKTDIYNTHINFSDIRKRFGQKQILDNSEIEITSGKCILLCGKNGSGKTTFLRIIAGLETPDSGFVNTGLGKYHWKKCRQQLRNSVVYLHQQPYMFEGDVISNLNFSLDNKLKQKQRLQRIRSALEWAGLESIAENSAKTLSGGELQRVAITRAWLRNPKILLLDEPVTNMDYESRLRTIDLLLNLKQQGVALVVSSHDPVHFEALTDNWLQLSEGRLSDYTSSENITPIHYKKYIYEHTY
ncbi:MAG: energy-coupling factor ABC transporter ATP-binding protein [Gammaproteobacteria bacterium]|nr:energy-coupling factor ABC transporter ATP-binding protein [Gammaproteobacteria bacterium]